MRTEQFESFSPKDTFEFGRKLGEKAKTGEIYALLGDLGVGKTALAGGFARGLGIDEPVTSPTFTILMEYHEGRIPLYHYDVYRIEDPTEMEEIGFCDNLQSDGVALVEWADQIEEILPEEVITIRIEKDLSRGFDYRKITIEIPEETESL